MERITVSPALFIFIQVPTAVATGAVLDGVIVTGFE
jgi:hypothetical protein